MEKKVTKNYDYTKVLSEIRNVINKAVHNNIADGILFSAGTDTSIIAFEALKLNPDLKAITVEFLHGSPKDKRHVELMAKFLSLKHESRIFDHKELLFAIEKVIEILKTFNDMEIRNSIPVYIGLATLKEKGIKSVFTGDGLDELFGYPWQFHLSEEEFQKILIDMWNLMHFSSQKLGKAVGLEIKQPYLDPEFMNYAKKIPIEFKVRIENGIKYGKWLVRKAYEDYIPKEITWRSKAACEQGTGTDILPVYFEKKISRDEFTNKQRIILEEDQVNLSTTEQLFYYEIFQQKFGKPSEVFVDLDGKKCSKCKGYVEKRKKCCNICGAYPI